MVFVLKMHIPYVTILPKFCNGYRYMAVVVNFNTIEESFLIEYIFLSWLNVVILLFPALFVVTLLSFII